MSQRRKIGYNVSGKGFIRKAAITKEGETECKLCFHFPPTAPKATNNGIKDTSQRDEVGDLAGGQERSSLGFGTRSSSPTVKH